MTYDGPYGIIRSMQRSSRTGRRLISERRYGDWDLTADVKAGGIL